MVTWHERGSHLELQFQDFEATAACARSCSSWCRKPTHVEVQSSTKVERLRQVKFQRQLSLVQLQLCSGEAEQGEKNSARQCYAEMPSSKLIAQSHEFQDFCFYLRKACFRQVDIPESSHAVIFTIAVVLDMGIAAAVRDTSCAACQLTNGR